VVWEEHFDVVVVGSGAAGFTAAIVAAGDGASVVVLEKAPTTGGTTRKSAAYFWILNNRHMRAAGIEDPREKALQYLARLARPLDYSPSHPTLGLAPDEFAALECFYDHGDDAIRALEDLGALEVGALLEFPDYFAQLDEDVPKRGRTLFPAAAEAGQHGGEVLLDTFHRAAQRLGVEVRTSSPVLELVLDEDGEAVGVIVGDEQRRRQIRAARGVVFASGGFTQDPRLVRQYLGGPYVGGCAAVGNTGDFVRLAQSAGAELANMNQAWSAPIALERLQRDPAGVAGSFVLPGDGLIVVNRNGERVLNEKAPYNEQARAFFAWDPVSATYPNLPLIAIWDEPVATSVGGSDFGNPVPPDGVDAYWVMRSDDLAGLETAIAERLGRVGLSAGHRTLASDFRATLVRTLERFGQFADAGTDLDFRRGETPIERVVTQMFGPGSGVNPTMRRLRPSGPYYATLLGPGTLDTKGGPRVDTNGRVLRPDGSVIPGLYGAGNCVASPSGEAYWGAGGTIGPILCFAYRAGRHVATSSRPEVSGHPTALSSRRQ
jgi:succinate dehydrogenase/fumarate reductase flavoprotein subunit